MDPNQSIIIIFTFLVLGVTVIQSRLVFRVPNLYLSSTLCHLDVSQMCCRSQNNPRIFTPYGVLLEGDIQVLKKILKHSTHAYGSPPYQRRSARPHRRQEPLICAVVDYPTAYRGRSALPLRIGRQRGFLRSIILIIPNWYHVRMVHDPAT